MQEQVTNPTAAHCIKCGQRALDCVKQDPTGSEYYVCKYICCKATFSLVPEN